MTGYVVDTDWTIDFLNGRANAIALFQELSSASLSISAISYAELWEGITFSKHAELQERRDALRMLARTIDILGVDRETAEIIGDLRATLRANGTPIPDFDLVIAATAIRHGRTLVSRDKHFVRVPRLDLRRS